MKIFGFVVRMSLRGKALDNVVNLKMFASVKTICLNAIIMKGCWIFMMICRISANDVHHHYDLIVCHLLSFLASFNGRHPSKVQQSKRHYIRHQPSKIFDFLQGPDRRFGLTYKPRRAHPKVRI